MLATEGIELKFSDDAVSEIARMAALVNDRTENIGARRLHTILEKLLEDLSFDAPERQERCVTVDADYVRQSLAAIAQDEDLSRYIL